MRQIDIVKLINSRTIKLNPRDYSYTGSFYCVHLSCFAIDELQKMEQEGFIFSTQEDKVVFDLDKSITSISPAGNLNHASLIASVFTHKSI